MSAEPRGVDTPCFVPAGGRVGDFDGRRVVLDFGDAAAEHAALVGGAGVVDISDHTQLEIRGQDRKLLLHNLCTNEIKSLQPGQGREAFVTNVQGKTIGLIQVYCSDEGLIVETVAGQSERLLAHFEKYHLREDVSFTDHTPDWFLLLAAGPKAAAALQEFAPLTLADAPHSHQPFALAGNACWLRRSNMLSGDCLSIAGPRSALAAAWQALTAGGFTPCGRQALESARIESGTPRFGADLTDKNLPQELARDAKAISFVKGCYLGQETVARLDAIGHVNSLLCGVQFAADAKLEAGLELKGASSAKAAGKITSWAWSYRLSAPLALAYLRRELAAPGHQIDSAAGSGVVVALPLS